MRYSAHLTMAAVPFALLMSGSPAPGQVAAGQLAPSSQLKCPLSETPCGEAAVAIALAAVDLPLTPVGLRIARPSEDAGACLENLGGQLKALGVDTELRRLSPRALRDSGEVAILIFRRSDEHWHYEVYLGAEGDSGRFGDAGLVQRGSGRLRPFADLGDDWGGFALIVRRPGGPSQGFTGWLGPAGATFTVGAMAAAGWWLAARFPRLSGLALSAVS